MRLPDGADICRSALQAAIRLNAHGFISAQAHVAVGYAMELAAPHLPPGGLQDISSAGAEKVRAQGCQPIRDDVGKHCCDAFPCIP